MPNRKSNRTASVRHQKKRGSNPPFFFARLLTQGNRLTAVARMIKALRTTDVQGGSPPPIKKTS
ncbi:hypothetical protein QBS70_21005, partial [Cronobacter sakazakii]|nr:hypothetical protein [Cronobacter sakazakii]